MLLGDFEEAREKYETALEICQDIDEKLAEANIFIRLGYLIMLLGNFEEAREKYETALRIYSHIDDKVGEANTFKHLGDLAVQTGDLEEARSKYETALEIYQHTDEKDGEASTLIRMSQWATLTGELSNAEANLDEAFMICRKIQNPEGLADAHMVKALVFFEQQDAMKAKHELDSCLSIQDKIHAYYKAVQWLILYAVHLRSKCFKESARICLEYAEEFAAKTQNQHLINQVRQQFKESV